MRDRPLVLPRQMALERKAKLDRKLTGEHKAKELRTKAHKKSGRYGDAAALRGVRSM